MRNLFPPPGSLESVLQMKKMRHREFQVLVQWEQLLVLWNQTPYKQTQRVKEECTFIEYLLCARCFPYMNLSLTWLVQIVEPQMSEESKVQRGWLLPRNTQPVSRGIRILPRVWCPGKQWAMLPSLHFRLPQELLLLPVSLADASRRLWLWTQLSIQAHTRLFPQPGCWQSPSEGPPFFCYFGTALLDWVTYLLSFGETEADKSRNGFKFVIGQLTAKLGSYICVMAERGWFWAHVALVQILWPWASPSNPLNLSFLICKMRNKDYLPHSVVRTKWVNTCKSKLWPTHRMLLPLPHTN